MGNAQSDAGEKEAFDNVISHIPVIGALYAPIRAVVYAGKNNEKEAKLSGLAFASGLVETGICFVPVAGPALKGISTAAKVAVATASMMGAGAVQGGIEYGIDKGRDMVNDGEMDFDDDKFKEARKVVSYIPIANLIYDGARRADGHQVEDSELAESGITTAGWMLPMKMDFRKTSPIRLKEGALKATESVAIPGAFNVGGKATERIPAKFGKSAAAAISAITELDEGSEEEESENPLVTLVNDPDTGLPIIVVAGAAMAVAAGVAGASYYLYRWYNGTDEGEDVGADDHAVVQSDVGSGPSENEEARS